MIALPPSEAGALHTTVACPGAAEADTFVGVPGSVLGVAAADSADGGPVPIAFFAETLNVYVVPFESPVTVASVTTPTGVTPRSTPPT